MKTKKEIQVKLGILKQRLQKKYPIASMALFGSYSREEQHDNSDVDVLIEFNDKIGSQFITLAEEIEQGLGQKIDLVSKNGIKKKYFDSIKADLIYV